MLGGRREDLRTIWDALGSDSHAAAWTVNGWYFWKGLGTEEGNEEGWARLEHFLGKVDMKDDDKS